MSANASKRIDQFLLMHSARADQWRGIAIQCEEWDKGTTGRTAVEGEIEAIAPTEGFFAYPGPSLFSALRERVAANDPGSALKLARRISWTATATSHTTAWCSAAPSRSSSRRSR